MSGLPTSGRRRASSPGSSWTLREYPVNDELWYMRAGRSASKHRLPKRGGPRAAQYRLRTGHRPGTGPTRRGVAP
jgi:hypothetical protein